MKQLIKWYFIFSSFILHAFGLVIFIKVADSLDSIIKFIGDIADKF